LSGAGGLAGRLDLELSPDGTPVNPLVVVDLDKWGAQAAREIAAAASAVRGALPVTAGVLRGPVTPVLAPLVESLQAAVACGQLVRQTAGSGVRIPGGAPVMIWGFTASGHCYALVLSHMLDPC
jgi:hypothetical protein